MNLEPRLKVKGLKNSEERKTQVAAAAAEWEKAALSINSSGK